MGFDAADGRGRLTAVVPLVIPAPLVARFVVLLLAFWAVAGLWLAPRWSGQIAAAARSALEAGPDAKRFAKVEVEAAGRSLRLRGEVATEAERTELLARLPDEVRVGHALSRSFPAVTGVQDELRVRERMTDRPTVPADEPGWVLAVLQGREFWLAGEVGSDGERRHLEAALESHWAMLRREGGITVQPGRPVSTALGATLTGVPPAKSTDLTEGRIFLARAGQPWLPAQPVAASDDAVRQAWQNAGMSPALIAAGLRARGQWRIWAAERARTEAMPRGHLALAAAGAKVWLRGEVATPDVRAQAVAAARQFYAGLEVIDEVRATSQRRPVGELGATLHSWPAAPEADGLGVIGLAVLGQPWKELRPGPGELDTPVRPWPALLPESFDLALAVGDLDVLAPHLQEHMALLEMSAPVHGHLGMIALGGRVLLRGVVADERMRVLVGNAVRRAYPERDLKEELRVEVGLTPADDEVLAATWQSWPALGEPAAPTLAFGPLGQRWRVAPDAVRQEDGEALLRPQAGLVPPGYRHPELAADLSALLGSLRTWQATQRTVPGWLTVFYAAGEVRVAGLVREDAARAALLTAVEKKADGWRVLSEGLLVEPRASLGEAWTVSLASVPGPPSRSPATAVVRAGFSVPGEKWAFADVPAQSLDIPQLAALPIFPPSFDVGHAARELESWAEQLHALPPAPAPTTTAPARSPE